tara:strand:+ start:2448 stop:3617 length:1170 start_codon:yes stop_codon:yes gene_type:complete
MAFVDNENNETPPLVTDDDTNLNPLGAGLSSTQDGDEINYVFNLGQFNVDASMTLDPSFAQPTLVEIGDAHFQANITWHAKPDEGWHKLFRFQADADDLTDLPATDIKYFCDPNAWLAGSDLSSTALSALGDTSFNLLASNGPLGPTGTDGVPLGSTAKLAPSGEETNNMNATGHEDSISKDFLRHIANEIMGGYQAGAKKGIVDIFNNETELLNDLNTNVNQQVYDSHHAILTTTKGNTTYNDVSSNIVTLYGDANGNVTINVTDTADNIAAEILKQILTSRGGSPNGIDRLDNLLTPNSAIADGTGGVGVDKDDANFDYRRRRNKKDFVELLQRGDKITFVVTIAPNTSTPLGNNPINDIKYRVVLTLKDDGAETADYTSLPEQNIS